METTAELAENISPFVYEGISVGKKYFKKETI